METNVNQSVNYMNEYVKPFLWEGKIKEECILLIHGITGSAADMRPLAAHLNKDGEGYPVCGILLPGHGTKMADMAPFTWKEWVIYSTGELKKLLETYPKVSVIGLSMGADIALCLASKFKVDRVVSISAPIIIKNRLNYFVELIGFFRKTFYWMTFKPLEGELRFNYESGYKGMPMRSIGQLRNMSLATRNRLKRIRQPILIVQPLKDRLVNLKSPYVIFDNVQSEYKELTLLENSRHNAILGPERDKLYSAVEEFLRKEVPSKEKML